MLRPSLLFAALLALPSPANSGWFGPSSYEECMLEKMKGQPGSMYSTADKYCAKAFKVERSITWSDIEWNWAYNSGTLIITITENNTEYEVVKGRFSFSSKECAESKIEDFDQTKKIEFRSGKKVEVFLSPKPICMKTLELWGKYK